MATPSAMHLSTKPIIEPAFVRTHLHLDGDLLQSPPRVARSWDRGGAIAPRRGEVEGVVVKDDAVLELCVRSRACYAQAHIPKRRSDYHGSLIHLRLHIISN